MQAQEQRNLIRFEGSVEGALAARAKFSQGQKGKKVEKNKKGNSGFDSPNTNKGTKYDFPPCKHCGRKGHHPSKCWKRPDQQCEKCQKMGHHQKICRSNPQQRQVTQVNLQQKNVAQVADQEEDEHLFVASCFATSSTSDKWLVDSGCTNHMTFDRDLFRELDTSVTSKVRIGNGEYLAVKGKGTVEIESILGTKLIKDVLFVPISQNLLSVGQLLERGFKIIFENNQCLIKDSKGEDVFKVNMKGKSFALHPLEEENAAYSAMKTNAELWHKRLGHFNHKVVMTLRRRIWFKDFLILN
ncbi:hypothetical protein Scep_007542 [Stephania cephalantha]|uniref:Retrovirus-related Pol polyprotein from transposon TNT 1-94-like beta-barrel domain-containing protein n=1 Tax=Stephania cephalantha TaxID=152367 RepID=A0AAP0KCR1_9MAGN